jgi:molybdate transport system substrate-binding protein
MTNLCCSLLAISSFFLISNARVQAQNPASELTVAAAADLSNVLRDIGDSFEKKTGIQVRLSFGASGALTQQIENGAPFDIFFSADMDYPRQLVRDGQADGPTPYEYAVGKLVLWVPADSALDVEHKGMSVLLDASVNKISIANPQHAPYGRAAVEAVKHAGLYDRLRDKFVMGENISQAAQFVESGNAQAAPAMQGKGKYWEIPADYYAPLAQGVADISRSSHKKEAEQFLEYIKTKPAKEVFQRYGFTVP